MSEDVQMATELIGEKGNKVKMMLEMCILTHTHTHTQNVLSTVLNVTFTLSSTSLKKIADSVIPELKTG